MNRREQVAEAVELERWRQERKFPGDLSGALPDAGKLAILVEEVGEVANELNERRLGNQTNSVTEQNLFEELIQVSAVASAWAESLLPQGGQTA